MPRIKNYAKKISNNQRVRRIKDGTHDVLKSYTFLADLKAFMCFPNSSSILLFSPIMTISAEEPKNPLVE